MQDKVVLERLKEIISGILRASNLDLVDLTFKKEGGRKILKVLADTENGITLDQCTEMNRVIGDALDKEGVINENYVLEVSSPGLDRPLKKMSDFFRVKDKRVCVYTYIRINEKKEFRGILEAVNEDSITIREESLTSVVIPVDKISKATLDYRSLI